MDDALLVRGLERRGDLPRDGSASSSGSGPRAIARGEVLALDQLHDEGARAAGLLEPVDLRDVRVVERGERLRLALEARQALGIAPRRSPAGP